MRKLQINTYSHNSGKLEDSLSIPLGIAKALAGMLPDNISSKFDENGEQLEALINAVKDGSSAGVLLELEDPSENERIVFSVV
ncbi:TPA: hypothetical protein NGS02_004713 [Vibrio parahaemolyticus]|nr:hypothetical protein [Vibrio parahaemolyticus]HCG5930169.1 hypothetical protein [Vibrio parahaemolyticus]